jgi:hypothetical protein
MQLFYTSLPPQTATTLLKQRLARGGELQWWIEQLVTRLGEVKQKKELNFTNKELAIALQADPTQTVILLNAIYAIASERVGQIVPLLISPMDLSLDALEWWIEAGGRLTPKGWREVYEKIKESGGPKWLSALVVEECSKELCNASKELCDISLEIAPFEVAFRCLNQWDSGSREFTKVLQILRNVAVDYLRVGNSHHAMWVIEEVLRVCAAKGEVLKITDYRGLSIPQLPESHEWFKDGATAWAVRGFACYVLERWTALLSMVDVGSISLPSEELDKQKKAWYASFGSMIMHFSPDVQAVLKLFNLAVGVEVSTEDPSGLRGPVGELLQATGVGEDPELLTEKLMLETIMVSPEQWNQNISKERRREIFIGEFPAFVSSLARGKATVLARMLREIITGLECDFEQSLSLTLCTLSKMADDGYFGARDLDQVCKYVSFLVNKHGESIVPDSRLLMREIGSTLNKLVSLVCYEVRSNETDAHLVNVIGTLSVLITKLCPGLERSVAEVDLPRWIKSLASRLSTASKALNPDALASAISDVMQLSCIPAYFCSTSTPMGANVDKANQRKNGELIFSVLELIFERKDLSVEHFRMLAVFMSACVEKKFIDKDDVAIRKRFRAVTAKIQGKLSQTKA